MTLLFVIKKDKEVRVILASDYIDSFKDMNGNVPVLLNYSVKNKKSIILLKVSAELAKYLYINRIGVYYTNAVRYSYKGKMISRDYYDRLVEFDKCEKSELLSELFGVIEIYVDFFPNLRLYSNLFLMD
ncbi:hypothetical protein CUS80_00280 [Enterococcus faecium]|uniref:hypothetical protein n=1 Tax=Enterococcus faecium TaxID=1352 RepID=UPI000CF352B6|nr:hypothetical protein [Enterococcus faecium]PQG48409.1 hypothetical protein CUS80_00280 [Enterococcus faecium]